MISYVDLHYLDTRTDIIRSRQLLPSRFFRALYDHTVGRRTEDQERRPAQEERSETARSRCRKTTGNGRGENGGQARESGAGADAPRREGVRGHDELRGRHGSCMR